MIWFTVRDGKNLPKIGQEILFVDDVRGTPDYFYRELTNKRKAEGVFFDVQIGGGRFVRLDSEEQEPTVQVKHGFVSDVGFSEEKKDWWISVQLTKSWNPLRITNGYADHVLRWMPMPEVPAYEQEQFFTA